MKRNAREDILRGHNVSRLRWSRKEEVNRHTAQHVQLAAMFHLTSVGADPAVSGDLLSLGECSEKILT